MNTLTPFAAWAGATQFGLLMMESQMVIGYRMLGLAGLWAVPGRESADMVSEKAPAFAEAYLGAAHAAMAGRSSDEILEAWTRPLRQRTRRNARRLGKLGWKRP